MVVDSVLSSHASPVICYSFTNVGEVLIDRRPVRIPPSNKQTTSQRWLREQREEVNTHNENKAIDEQRRRQNKRYEHAFVIEILLHREQSAKTIEQPNIETLANKSFLGSVVFIYYKFRTTIMVQHNEERKKDMQLCHQITNCHIQQLSRHRNVWHK